jgi:asparagine synthase (glutamine-hydrolysing)
MCGIAGYFLPDGCPGASLAKAMCDLIRHRGPDDEGYYSDNVCALGMRRLSILDLDTGHQPISNEDGSVWVVFNGEIYNHQQLRAELAGHGHIFRTRSDTEVLVHLYEQFGVEGIAKLRGMFAYAIWDARSRSLLLARDRFGKKPLYYAVLPAGVYFGSELKCLRRAGVPLELDRHALRLYCQFNYIPDPWSPFRSVKKLMPGSWMLFRADGSHTEGQYWSLPQPVSHASGGLTERAACEQVRAVFDEAVRLRMIADVPLGAFLSGGIDSGSVVASMALQSRAPVKTFSIGFEEASHNELAAAALVAGKYNTEHHEIVLRPDCIHLVSSLPRYFDEPFGDSSAIPAFLVSEFAAQHVKVALSGDGGDELFAGYDSVRMTARMRFADYLPQVLRRALGAVGDALPYSAYGKNFLRAISRPDSLSRYFELNSAPYYLRSRLLEADWMLPAGGAYLEQDFAGRTLPDERDPIVQALFFEVRARLTGDMLVKMDRMSMANSLEVRSPMLDHELAGIAMQIPYSWNMRGGLGKRLLVKALGDRLPAELLALPKKGFALPLAKWFRGPLRSYLYDHLTSTPFRRRGIASGAFLQHLLEEHDSGRRDNDYWLYALLMLELWLREWES